METNLVLLVLTLVEEQLELFKPNLRTVKAVVNGETQTIHACAKCLRSGKVARA